ncbi:hypothetical protein KTO58_16305 [Chitinophaga pendula]|uniref:thioesterase domain-containing protein n=1 Tax=Chitinophaga TaxID=79328 RepID=UPI000BAFC641|nr:MULTISPECIES: thioesterase domain-containing protein [Chitinophaga]ASZ11725.1 hypothetical protein CK934_12540 [Chitinophaga sp. MD30]UCJ05255.1 hypothetical protein KTO58_16305 [Chitinophaga pendula]
MELKTILNALKNGDMSVDDAKRVLNNAEKQLPTNIPDSPAEVLFAPGSGNNNRQTSQKNTSPDPHIALLRLKDDFEALYQQLSNRILQQTSPADNTFFPEIVQLNKAAGGKPVFWFHAALGTGEIYHMLARNIQRPFYGIHARGWINDAPPIHSVPAMAAYYIHLIRSVQPHGPYDLGGYSLGGKLSYEVTRQLQQLGETVNSIVMLDPLYVSNDVAFSNINASIQAENKSHGKGIIFQTGNFILSGKVMLEAQDIFQVLIKNHELDWAQDEEAFLSQLITLFNDRIRSKVPPADLAAMINRCIEIRTAFEMHQYICRPLEYPDQVTCYYFRNKSNRFYGELMPFFADPALPADHTDYSLGWARHFTNFHFMDMDVSNHFMMLTNPTSNQTITNFCETLYSLQPPSQADITALQDEMRRIHKY